MSAEDRHLGALRALAPSQARYLDVTHESGTLIAGWNLVVPERILTRAWEEVS